MTNDTSGGTRNTTQKKTSRCIPKEETGLYDLYEKYPGSDGAGVKIAVMDTGCDLRAAGLSGTTSDGTTPKYIDFVDCTGDGDVPMNETAEFDYATKSAVEGLSGRTLRLGEWAEHVSELKLGAARLYELLPRGVLRRVKRERKEAFLTKHRTLTSETQASLDRLRSGKGDGADGDGDDEKRTKELELLLEQLNAAAEAYEDHGPLLDIVMFEIDDVWKVAIDLEADGDLTKVVPMAPFGRARQVGELGFGAHVSFCVQVYDEGNTLSVVTDAGSHGTHVAGIAAAYFPSDSSEDEGRPEGDDPNGAAPGAQILALKIGDGRLGSAETGTGLIRGLIAAKKHGCDLINLSYGEPSWQPDRGRVSEVFAKAVNEWGMTVFASAGNDGPALSSLGSPGSVTAPVTVGAYVSPAMMVEQYSTLPPVDEDDGKEDPPHLEGASYYFSSRGPTPDGYLPDVCGPGGAIAPIPRHALQGKAQYDGTSMSSPNVCGVAACVLSAARQGGLNDWGPAELKRALINTARPPEGVREPLSQGSGLVSALDCAEYLLAHRGKPGQDVALDVSVPSRNGARGIYLRDEAELDGPLDFSVKVLPRFDHANPRTPSEVDQLLSLELDLLLKSSEGWVTCPERMTLLSAKERRGQTFSVRLNTRGLKPGVHYASVDAVCASDPARGKLFSLPVTVVVPHSRFLAGKSEFSLNDKEHISLEENGIDYSTVYHLRQGVPNRRFLTVPAEAEWATIKIKSGPSAPADSSPRILLHAVPFVRGDLHNRECQLKKIVQIKSGVEDEFHVPVKAGSCLEVCLQLLWLANPAPASVQAVVEFHSLNARSPTLVSSQPIAITPAAEYARLGAGTPLRAEQINPACSLKSVIRTLRPREFDIKLGSSERDAEPPSDAELASHPDAAPSRIYELRTRYDFAIEGDKAVKVRPCFPSLFRQLYDSPLDSQLWSLEDGDARVLAYGSSMDHAKPTSLRKGNYTVNLLLRHPNRTNLEAMKDVPCEVSFALESALTCKVYDKLDVASTPNVKEDRRVPLQKKVLPKGAHQDIYVSRPTNDLPAWVAPGDVFEGSLALDKDKEGVTSMKVVYVAPPKSCAKDAKKKEKPGPAEKKDTVEDVVFKAKLGYMAGLRKDAALYRETAAKLKEERPSSIPLFSELLSFSLQSPVPADETDEDKWRAREVERVYEAILKENGGPVDAPSLAQYFGLNEPDKDELDEDAEAKDLDEEMKEQRDVLKKILLARATLAGSIADKDASESQGLDRAVKEAKKWVSADNLKGEEDKIKLSIALARHARICQGRKASAISILLKARKDRSGKGLKALDEELVKTYDACEGMGYLSENLKEGIHCRFPVLKRSV
ncbi:hypothetical protein ACHAWF_014431 [Thalassiosira exigua]